MNTSLPMLNVLIGASGSGKSFPVESRTLQEPDSAQKLVDALVYEDSSGEVSIRIPVRTKDSVKQFVSLLGKLMNGIG